MNGGRATNWVAVYMLIGLGILEVLVVVAVGVFLSRMASSDWFARLGDEILLTLMLLAGMVGFITVLATSVAVFSALGLSDRAAAFGLPEGSVRALIALSLVIIFAMTSVYLYGQLRSQPGIRVSGVSQEQAGRTNRDRAVFKASALTCGGSPSTPPSCQ